MYNENWWNENTHKIISLLRYSITWIPLYFIYASVNSCVLNKYEIIWWEKKLVRQFVTRVGSIDFNMCAFFASFFSPSLYLTILSFASESLGLDFYWINKQSQCCNWQFDCFSFSHSENIFVFCTTLKFILYSFFLVGCWCCWWYNLIETIIWQQSDNAPLTVDSISEHYKRSSMMKIAGTISICTYFIHSYST